jgi:hypothetical protein
LQQDADAAIAFIGHRREVGGIEAELLVLGADAPFALRLRTRLEIGDRLVPRRDVRLSGPLTRVDMKSPAEFGV